MKKSTAILLYPVLLICCATCTKIIEIDIPAHEPKLVVNSLFTDGHRFKVHLSKTASAFDYSTPTVEDGLIRLFCNDEEIDTLIFNNGYYYSNINAEQGEKYSLIVIAPEMDDVSSEDSIPKRTLIESYVHRDSVMMSDNNYPVMQLELRFTDKPGPDFYELSIAADYYVAGFNYRHNVGFQYSTDPVLVSTGLLDYYAESIVFTDELFDREQTSIKANYWLQTGEMPLIGGGPEYGYLLFVSLRSISESYYNYIRKQIIYQYSLESNIFTGLPDPVHMYSNIKGGYGIFAGYSSDNKTISVVIR
ncbi:MAG: DUF4249 domain-containing protein [Bacteroidales bacterium]|nr:DUF4249 domain-containing protein [Bacteroidales bacterium]